MMQAPFLRLVLPTRCTGDRAAMTGSSNGRIGLADPRRKPAILLVG
jgi:hypothetical protein